LLGLKVVVGCESKVYLAFSLSFSTAVLVNRLVVKLFAVNDFDLPLSTVTLFDVWELLWLSKI
jgi:hypothetical protein